MAISSSDFDGMNYKNANIEINCGSDWSEWSGASDQCGDRIQSRTRIDEYGLATKESRNIGYNYIV